MPIFPRWMQPRKHAPRVRQKTIARNFFCPGNLQQDGPSLPASVIRGGRLGPKPRGQRSAACRRKGGSCRCAEKPAAKAEAYAPSIIPQSPQMASPETSRRAERSLAAAQAARATSGSGFSTSNSAKRTPVSSPPFRTLGSTLPEHCGEPLPFRVDPHIACRLGISMPS